MMIKRLFTTVAARPSPNASSNVKKIGLMFPGQGSQFPGMAKDLIENFPIAKDTLAEVDEAIKFSLSKRMFEGPQSELTMTENAQPALLAHSIAAFRILESEIGPSSLLPVTACAMGHSLGEYSALVASGALTLSDAARIVRRRGQAMQNAVPAGEGAMAALMPGDEKAALMACAEVMGQHMKNGDAVSASKQEESSLICGIANINAPGQIVISGHKSAVEKAVEIAKAKHGVKRAIFLDVSAPFHCALMKPAAVELSRVLRPSLFHKARVPVLSNVDASDHVLDGSIEGINASISLLLQQVTAPVRWSSCVEAASKRHQASHFVELGPGTVLAGLVKRILPSASVSSLGNADEMKKYLKAFRDE